MLVVVKYINYLLNVNSNRLHNNRCMGGNVGEKSRHEQRHNHERNWLVALVGRRFDGRIFDCARILLHTPNRLGYIVQQTQHLLQWLERISAKILNHQIDHYIFFFLFFIFFLLLFPFFQLYEWIKLAKFFLLEK